MKKVIALVFALAYIGLTGCNTVQGFGKDVEKTGDKIEEGAKKAKQ